MLVLGVYLADRPNNIHDIVEVLAESEGFEVHQKWIALGGNPPSEAVSRVTAIEIETSIPKFELINQLLAREVDIMRYDYVVLADDDILLPRRFLDHFLTLQGKFEFALAQPARTSNSYIDHPIVERQRGVIARQTHFVEIGPVVSFSRPSYGLFPFDSVSPMGWGYENLWSAFAAENEMKIGIIDAAPVEHSLRPAVAHYSWDAADRGRKAILAKYSTPRIEDCYRVVDVITSVNGVPARNSALSTRPLISVVIPTRNRSTLLESCLESMKRQSIDPASFEVIVIDDGSADDTPEVCVRFSGQLALRCFSIEHSGIAAAKNLGIFVANSPIILFFDDDDVASTELLQEHIRAHELHSDNSVAVLGYTDWSPNLEVTEIMRYVTDIGGFLFSYGNLSDGQWRDYTYFWGGRSSCKRDLLVRHGIFNQKFCFGSEDIELGYRLKHFGLRVVHHRNAIQYMNRPVSFSEFCQRCERQGRSMAIFAEMHAEEEIQNYCAIPGANNRWEKIRPDLPLWVSRIEEIEASLSGNPASSDNDSRRQELWKLYHRTFHAFKLKGIVEKPCDLF